MILGIDRHVAANCFQEINDSVQNILSGARDSRLVVFNAHNFTAPHRSIVFNLENVPGQVNPARWAGYEIWDASLRNISNYPVEMKVTHVPMGYEPTMKRFERRPIEDRDIDVVFCGYLNERRMSVLHSLRRRGIKVTVPEYDSWGKERDNVIARAKLALDMRYYDDGIFPTLRSLHLIANGMPVVAETSPEMPPWILQNTSYEKLADLVEAMLTSEEEMNALSLESEIILKKHPLQLPSLMQHKHENE